MWFRGEFSQNFQFSIRFRQFATFFKIWPFWPLWPQIRVKVINLAFELNWLHVIKLICWIFLLTLKTDGENQLFRRNDHCTVFGGSRYFLHRSVIIYSRNKQRSQTRDRRYMFSSKRYHQNILPLRYFFLWFWWNLICAKLVTLNHISTVHRVLLIG